MSRRQYAHNWRCIVKRFWIMLVAAAMAIAVALPAEAGKPVKPDKPDPTLPTLFDVTFEFEGDNAGFSTTDEQCTTGGSITMEAGPGGRLGATGDIAIVVDGIEVGKNVPLFEVRLPELEWHRYYPYYAQVAEVPDPFDPNTYPLEPLGEGDRLAGDNLTGCHGAGIQVLVSQAIDGTKEVISVADYPRFLMLTVGDGSVDFRWEADYYLANLETASKNPRKPTVSSAMEGFSYTGSNLVWDETSGLVTGWIDVSHFSPGVYEPFPGSPVDVEFMMTICPHGSGECPATSE